jgi:hypothetical protein
VYPPRSGKAPLPEEAIFNKNKAAAERRRAVRKAQHKEREIAKSNRNDDRIKRQKAVECGVSSNDDPSPEPSWSGDVPSAAVDWSDMSGSSSSSPPRAIEVSSSRRPQTTAHDKKVGSSSQPALPERTSGWSALVWCQEERAPPSRRKSCPAKLTPPEAVGGAASSRLSTFRWF